jgi:LysR family transcriptional regulator, salicylic acid-responsive activator of bsdBCD
MGNWNGICRTSLEHQELTYHHLINEPFIFVSKKEINTISLEEISRMPLIIPSTEGLGIYNTILEAFTRQKLPLTSIAECSDMHVLMELVKGGMGVTIVPKSVFDVYGEKTLYGAPIHNANMISSLGVIWREHHYVSTPARNFVKLVQEYYRH